MCNARNITKIVSYFGWIGLSGGKMSLVLLNGW